ncbi:MAG: four helix bundle protein [Lentisphaerae bacterium]|nr:four helix bundle protein [Lentisphaerota bacterium]
MGIRRFEDIEAWQLARCLTARVYALTEQKRFSMDSGLRDQMRRAAVSITSNIAEGFDGGSHAEFAKFLQYAQRSCSELQSQLYVVLDCHGMDKDVFKDIYGEIGVVRQKLGAFIKYLRTK